jgi:C4-dicarboxylate-specific signal transduction histidine kinase
MTEERFEFLAGRLLDGELTDDEVEELTAAVRADPSRRRELRQHLVLWELWAQQQAPERSADAFLAAWHTRLRAERQGDEFVVQVRERLSHRARAASLLLRALEWWRRAAGPIRIACAAGAAAVVLVACLWLVIPQHARATTTLKGEAVCTACMLHETHEHLPAIRVQADGAPRIYYIQSDPHALLRPGHYCAAPVPLTVTGRSEIKNGRLMLDVESAEAVVEK